MGSDKKVVGNLCAHFTDVTTIYGRKLEERRSKFAINSREVTLIDGDRVDPLLHNGNAEL
jgi:hypothetical protein